MKRCPQCNSLFRDEENFCEIDGTRLVAETDEPESPPDRLVTPQPASDRSVQIVLVVAASIFGVLLVFGYLVFTRQREQPDHSPFSSSATQPKTLSTPIPAPRVPTPSPTEEPSPSPSASPSPSPQATSTPFQLSSNPISTNVVSKEKSGPVKIVLDSGVTIEAEEVWQTGEGIWYRKGTVISLIDPKHIKAIEKAQQPTTGSAAASPSP